MKITLLLLLFFQSSAFAQCDTTNAIQFPDTKAEFPGGAHEMMKFVQSNLSYPEKYTYGSSWKYYFKFIVCDDGKIEFIDMIGKTHSQELDEIGIKLIEKMPNWIPAKLHGNPVTSVVWLPISICPQ